MLHRKLERIWAPRLNWQFRKFSFVNSKSGNSLDFHNYYTQTQVSTILETVNQRSEFELTQFNISKSRLSKIKARKQKQGDFSTLEEILELDGFGVKVLERFCDSILSSHKNDSKSQTYKKELNEEDTHFPAKMKKPSFVTPIIPENFRKTITSCISFHLDLNNIAWTKMNLEDAGESKSCSIFVDDWMTREIGKEDKKLSISELMNNVLDLSDEIPEADTYVIEAIHQPQIPKQPGNPTHVNINVQRSQLFSMLSILMAARYRKQERLDSPEEKQLKQQVRVFFLKTYLSSRLFKVYVGQEKVSSKNIVSRILSGNLGDQPSHILSNPIKVRNGLKTFFDGSSNVEKEYLGQSLLVGIAFIKLCLLKCPKSIAELDMKK